MCVVVALPGIDRQPTRLYKNLDLPSINPTNGVTLGAVRQGKEGYTLSNESGGIMCAVNAIIWHW